MALQNHLAKSHKINNLLTAMFWPLRENLKPWPCHIGLAILTLPTLGQYGKVLV